jgi:hypothetical protein
MYAQNYFFLVESPSLKILKSRRTKIVPNECPQLLRLKFLSNFEFEFFPYKNATSAYSYILTDL